MPFIAKSAAPVGPAPTARHWTFDRAALGGLTSFVAPPGYLLSEGLFEALQRQGRPVIWVRLGPEDRDPGTLLRSLVAAVQRHHPGFGWELVGGAAGDPPGPDGWPARFARLAAAVAEASPPPASLVVEHAHHLGGPGSAPGGGSPAPALLGVLLGPLLDEDRACIVTTDEPLPAGVLPARGATVTADDLRLGPGAAGELLGREAPRLPAAAARRVASLCRGAAANLAAVCGALRTGWRDPLRAALAPTRPLGAETVHRAADYLVDRGAAERAVPLYLELEDGDCAAGAAAGPVTTLAPPQDHGRPAGEPDGHLLTVHLLGQLKVGLDDVAVDDWPSGRGRSLFKYLVTHRHPWPRREQLMAAFWPEAAPAAARNSLNVAVHGLRRAFRDVAEVQVVVLEDGSYRLGPGLALWLDVDELELHVAGGRRLEAAGDLAGAAAEYERALALYQGDFLADDPYEDWPVTTREHLLLAYLDVLDRLSALYFGQHQYGACAALCRLLVERDRCREDAHRRLMRCFTRQGQPHLALRQYQACADALHHDLGVDPDPATVALAQQIRRHQPV
jgi:DNA-binding SARP family transcriptional activator